MFLSCCISDKDIAQISCGINHCAAVTKYGDVFCWGESKEGQCGVPAGSTDNETCDNVVSTPQLVELVKTCDEVCEHGNTGPCEKIVIKKVACGKNHTVALSTENELWVWGSGIALGIAPPTKTLKPTQVETLLGRNILDIICGEMYTVAVVERSVLDDTPRKRQSDLIKTTHKHFPSTCAKCNEEIYSYMETSDTCIITEDHVCAENKNSVSSDLSQGIVHLEEDVPSENSLENKSSEKSDSIPEDSSSKKDNNILKQENSSANLNSNVVEKTMKSNIEENISEKGASSVEMEVNCGSSEKGVNSSSSVKGDNSSRSEEPAVNMSQSVDDIWKKHPPERSPSSKSDSGVIKSISFIDEKNARDFLAKQLDDEDFINKTDCDVMTSGGSIVKNTATDIWSSVQSGSSNLVQSAYALPQQMTGMIGSFKASLIERMTYAADEKEDTGSSMDSNIHLVGFDTSDEDVFHATQVVEHQLSQEDKSNLSSTDDSAVKCKTDSDSNVAESSFIEGIKSEITLLNQSKTDEQGDTTLEGGSQLGETTTTPRYSMRTILAKQDEMDRKVSTRSSSKELFILGRNMNLLSFIMFFNGINEKTKNTTQSEQFQMQKQNL